MTRYPPIKAAVEGMLRLGGPARVAAAFKRGRTLTLAYHNIVSDGAPPAGDRSLHLPRRQFAAQLDHLAGRVEVVPLERALAEPGGRPGRPRVVITFDDAYRGAVTAGVEELSRRGLPATIFVAPNFLGGRSFWWDALAPVTGEGLPEEFRARALLEFRGDDMAVRRSSAGGGSAVHEVPPEMVCASEEELRTALRHPGISLGSHSWSHPNLCCLNPDQLRDELVRPLQWLRSRFERTIPWLSYPYGLSSPAVEQAAAEAGYTAALRIEGGWLPRHSSNRFALPRLNLPSGLSFNGFALRVSGLFCR